MAGGHLRDALTALDAVRPTDPQRADADRLRADIQQQLLALATLPAVPAASATRRSPHPMKCPKCGYLGFERVDRCRNCGYDFSLTSTVTVPDLTLRSGDRGHWRRSTTCRSSTPRRRRPPADRHGGRRVRMLDRVLARCPDAAAETSRQPRQSRCRCSAPPSRRRRAADHAGVAAAAAARRSPRHAGSAAAARRTAARRRRLDLALDASRMRRPASSRRSRAGSDAVADATSEQPEDTRTNAPVIARVLAVVIDLLILAAIDASSSTSRCRSAA